jgi:DNA-binding GntR family transcriptional regulator
MPKRERPAMEQAYSAIKDRIMTLQVRPGQRLDDIELGEKLGISRTPVREALFRLGSEGLVSVSARGGFTVRAIDLLDIRQLFEAQIVMARAVGRLVALRATGAEISAMRTAADEVDAAINRRAPAEIAASNAALHRLEATAARNNHLKGLAHSLHDQGQRLAYLCFGGELDWTDDLTDHFTKVTRDHHDFLDAVVSRDPQAAEGIAARHVHLFRGRVQQFMFSEAMNKVSLAEDLDDGGDDG